jgi:hypothetical protein
MHSTDVSAVTLSLYLERKHRLTFSFFFDEKVNERLQTPESIRDRFDSEFETVKSLPLAFFPPVLQ